MVIEGTSELPGGTTGVSVAMAGEAVSAAGTGEETCTLATEVWTVSVIEVEAAWVGASAAVSVAATGAVTSPKRLSKSAPESKPTGALEATVPACSTTVATAPFWPFKGSKIPLPSGVADRRMRGSKASILKAWPGSNLVVLELRKAGEAG